MLPTGARAWDVDAAAPGSQTAAPAAGPQTEPWEPGDAPRESGASSALSDAGPITAMLLGWIGYYQRHIAVNSVQRCPFALSCSRYAQDRIGRLGLYGVLLFVDRYFYRETVFARQTYPYTVRPDGTMALDDGHLELE